MKTSSSQVFWWKEAVEVIEATEVIEAVEVIEAAEDQSSFRTEAVEDRDVTFKQIQGS